MLSKWSHSLFLNLLSNSQFQEIFESTFFYLRIERSEVEMKKRKVQEIEAWGGDGEKKGGVVKILETGIDYGTFGNIWAASLCFARYVSTSEGKKRLEGKRVLELGSGTGLGGMSSVIFGNADSVVLTDMPIAMDDLNNNVSINKTKADDRRFSTMSLTMGNEDNESHEKIISLKQSFNHL